jgi:hypothetical protein
MDAFGYRIVAQDASAEDLHLHVFARAYRDAWLALKRQPPVGQHRLERLGVTIEYQAPEEPG